MPNFIFGDFVNKHRPFGLAKMPYVFYIVCLLHNRHLKLSNFFVSLKMQGKKVYQEKLFNNFQLSTRVPKENFYRRLKGILDLEHLYKRKRQSTVEPVFGTLTQFMGLRKINTIGLEQANKVMHMAAIAYNLKKYLKFIKKSIKSDVGVGVIFKTLKNTFHKLVILFLSPQKIQFYKLH